jgi:hypothetical protein
MVLADLAGLSRDLGVITDGSVSETETDPRQAGRSVWIVEFVVPVGIAFS